MIINNYLQKQKILIIIFFISISIRLISKLIFNFNFPDANHYLYMAIELQKNFNFDNDLSMPGYPLILMISNIIFSNYYFLDLLFSALFSIIIYFLSLAIFKEKDVAFLTSIISTIYPMNIFYSFSGLSENSFVFFIYLSFLFFFKKKYYSSLLFLVLATYIRPVSEFFIPMLLLLIIFKNKNNFRDKLNLTLKLILLYILLFSPWWIYNYKKYDTFVRTTLGTGQVLYLGNNEDNLTGGNNIGVDGDFKKFKNISDPIQKNEIIFRESINFIFENPKNFLKLSVKKFFRYWNVIPNNETLRKNLIYKGVIFFSFFPVLIFSLIYILKNYKDKSIRKLSLLLLFVLYMTAIHTITISSLRYRYPIEPILIIFACKAFADLTLYKKYFQKFLKIK